MQKKHNRNIDYSHFLEWQKDLGSCIGNAFLNVNLERFEYILHSTQGLYNALIIKDDYICNLIIQKYARELKNFSDDFVILNPKRRPVYNAFKRAFKLYIQYPYPESASEFPLFYFQYLLQTALLPLEQDIDNMKKSYNALLEKTNLLGDAALDKVARSYSDEWFYKNALLQQGQMPKLEWRI